MKELSSLDSGTARKKAVKISSEKKSLSGSKHDFRPLYTFLITLVLYIIVMLLCNKYPLGKYSFLQSDMKAQYAPFLALMRSKISELGSIPKEHWLSYLSYSFKLGLGKNYLGTFGYYLASPFNLIYLFIDGAQIDAAVLTIIVLKLSLSSCFMCLFLSCRTENKKTLLPILFGIMYAFSLYSQAYIFQMMWLDGFMLLPLILYFTEKFIKKQNYAGLVISLLVLFISNYYIAYMVGIACFLYLGIRMFAEKVKLKTALLIGLRYALAAGFTALITATLLVPVGLDTIRNADQTVSSRDSMLITYTPLTLIHMLLEGESGEFSDVLSSNYPFLFISLPVTILVLIYFVSPVFKGREKKIYAGCVLGVFLSTMVYIVDKAWQVFDDPNWFWHRQAFVFLPVFLIISFKTLLKIKEVDRRDIIKVMLGMFALIFIDYSFGAMEGQPKALVFNVILSGVYCLIFILLGKTDWHEQLSDMPSILPPIMATIIGFEMLYVGPMLSSNIESMTLFGGPAEEYSDSLRAEKEFGTYAKTLSASTGAFRAEGEGAPEYTTKFYAEEGQAFYGNYNGLSFFNSNSNKKMHRFVKQLGMPANYNYFSAGHSFACPSNDAFFSIGAVSSRRDLTFYRQDGQDSYESGLKFYANENVLPLAFAADKGALDFDYYRLEKDAVEKDYFAFQNDWYRSMFPDEFTEDFFVEIDETVTGEPMIANSVFFNTDDYLTNEERINRNTSNMNEAAKGKLSDPLGLENSVYFELNSNMTTLYRSNENIPIIIEYEFKAPSEDEIYCSLATGRILDGAKVYVNGIEISSYSSNAYYSQMFRIGSFKTGDTVKVTFLSDEDKFSFLNIRFASFDSESFSKQFAAIDRTKVNTESVSDGYVKFGIQNMADNDTVITTIPFEDGWQLYLDGEPVEHSAYQDAFISFDVPAGNHTAELVFTAPGLKTGALVSCVGIVCLAAFIIIDKNRSKMKEKH